MLLHGSDACGVRSWLARLAVDAATVLLQPTAPLSQHSLAEAAFPARAENHNLFGAKFGCGMQAGLT